MLTFGVVFGTIIFVAAGVATCIGLTTEIKKGTRLPGDRADNQLY